MEANKYFFNPKYNEEKGKLLEFLSTFQDPNIKEHIIHKQLKYMIQLQNISNGDSFSLEILIEDLDEFFRRESDELLLSSILKNTKRYTNLLQEAAQQIIPERDRQQTIEEEFERLDLILQNQRKENLRQQSVDFVQNEHNLIPSQLQQSFETFIIAGPNYKNKITQLRQLKSDKIGSLVTVKCIAVRVSDVKPLIQIASYVCDACGYEIYQTVTNQQYMPLTDCPSNSCVQNKTRGKLINNIANSKFLSFQEIKIQETSDQCPIGNTPRMFNVYVYGQNTRQCSPGDLVLIQGVLCPKFWDSRGENMRSMDVYIEGYRITKEKKKYNDLEISQEFDNQLKEMLKSKSSEQIYDMLSQSIAPEIYGLNDVKKALLLLMVGGTSMQMHDGMKIRGDINVALIGDPGVAKSQLLKHISMISPRGVYTTGKGSSGVGLTAAVLRDPITNELCLEGGALVLADMGVCCIDEFDKMDERDRTSIHEVMEQQTVSIAKAGITTSLNARTSVLAAANPVYGRYNKKISVHQNINLPASLLSRFDLIFLLLDEADKNRDEMLARHIGFVHKNLRHPDQQTQTLNNDFMRQYISQAKNYNPCLDQNTQNYILNKYIQMRKNQQNNNKGDQYTTARTLLGIIRLSQAMARLRFSDNISQEDIEEALRLMEKTQEQINEDNPDIQNSKQKDILSNIYQIIRELCSKNTKQEVKISDIQDKIRMKSYVNSDLDRTIQIYSSMGIINQIGDKIQLLQ